MIAEINVNDYSESVLVGPHSFDLSDQTRIVFANLDNNLPTVVCSAVTIQQMMIYCTRITSIDAQDPTKVLSALCEKMEQMKYYKFWLSGTEDEMDTLCNYFKEDSILNRYSWYDEDIIPANSKSERVAYNLNRPIRSEDVLIRIFVLKQPARVEIFRTLNISDYEGTCLDKLL